MNKLIGEALIHNNEEGIRMKDVKFKIAKDYSPYIEVNNNYLNESPDKEIEVNPYYRFIDIFTEMLHPENTLALKYDELRETVIDFTFHFLGGMDREKGSHREILLVNKLVEELLNGRWGIDIQNKFFDLKKGERQEVAYNLYRYYDTGDSIYFFIKTIKDIIAGSLIYKKKDSDKYLLYIGCKENEGKRLKLSLIRELFLPFKEEVEVYWENHFGIIDQKETMKIGRIAMF